MARIALTSSNFKRIPEGIHTLYIYDVRYDETFGQLDLYFYSETTGDTHRERYFLLSKDGSEQNENAINAFSYTAHVALNDFEVDDIDPVDLIGHRIVAKVEHQANNGKTYVRLNEKAPYEGLATEYPWETSVFKTQWEAKTAKSAETAKAPASAPAPAPAAEENQSVDDLLAMLKM